MKKLIPSLSDKQLKVYEVVHRVRMAWVTLAVVLLAFVGVLITLIYAAFSPVVGPYVKGAFATIDSLLGLCLHQVVRHLYPTRKN
jgi:hypothetical protein